MDLQEAQEARLAAGNRPAAKTVEVTAGAAYEAAIGRPVAGLRTALAASSTGPWPCRCTSRSRSPMTL